MIKILCREIPGRPKNNFIRQVLKPATSKTAQEVAQIGWAIELESSIIL